MLLLQISHLPLPCLNPLNRDGTTLTRAHSATKNPVMSMSGGTTPPVTSTREGGRAYRISRQEPLAVFLDTLYGEIRSLGHAKLSTIRA